MALSTQIASVFALIFFCSGCAGHNPSGKRDLHLPGVMASESPAEQKLLEMLPGLPTGSKQVVEGMDVLAEESYWSGSGRFCRWVQVSRQGVSSRKLACAQETGWTWVPSVNGAPRTTASLGAHFEEN